MRTLGVVPYVGFCEFLVEFGYAFALAVEVKDTPLAFASGL